MSRAWARITLQICTNILRSPKSWRSQLVSHGHPITAHYVMVRQASRHLRRDVTPPAPVHNERYRTPAGGYTKRRTSVRSARELLIAGNTSFQSRPPLPHPKGGNAILLI